MLPPGQRETRKFPVTGEPKASQSLDLASWRLRIDGTVGEPVTLTFDDLLAFRQEALKADIHCVTGWSQLGMEFEGVRLRDVLQRHVSVEERAAFVRFEAYSQRKHDTSLPLAIALEDSWLVHRFDGQPLTPEHGFPVRVVTPSLYFYKSLKWLKSITLLETDALGFWERTSGYHNHGDPWKEERLEGTRFTSSQEAEAFRQRTDFSSYREAGGKDRVIVKASFRDWRPATRDLRGLQLKACDFRGADLRGADLSGANLTLGKFQGAHLEQANFTDTDLEGADFSGSFLAGAQLVRNPLSACVFQDVQGQGLRSWEGLKVVAPAGLLESQETYLSGLGVLTQAQG